MRKTPLVGLVVLTAGLALQARAGGTVRVEGYLEFRKAAYLIVDGQRVEVTDKTKVKAGKIHKAADLPLGYVVRASGKRGNDGTLVASQIEARANGSEFMESQVLAGTDQAEKAFVQSKKVADAGPRRQGARHRSAGRIRAAGRPRARDRGPPPPLLRRPQEGPGLRRGQQGMERHGHGQLLHLRVQRPDDGPGRRRAGHRPGARDRARHLRAQPPPSQVGHDQRRRRTGSEHRRRLHRQRPGPLGRPGGDLPRRHDLRQHVQPRRTRTRPTAWACATSTRPATTTARRPTCGGSSRPSTATATRSRTSSSGTTRSRPSAPSDLEQEIARNYADPKKDPPTRVAAR